MKKENATSNQEHARGSAMMSHDGELTPKESYSHLLHACNKDLTCEFVSHSDISESKCRNLK